MGYLSDIKLITTKAGWEKLKQAEKEARPNPDWGLYLEDERTTPLCHDKYVLFEIEDVKWYETRDAQVDAIMATLNSFNEQSIPYSYLRVGEDWEDIDYSFNEEWLSYDDMPELALKREIEVEY